MSSPPMTAPNVNHHIPLLPGINVRCGLRLPIAQVLPLSPGNAQLVSTIRDEDPERVPSKRSDQVLVYSLAYQCLLQPSQASVTRARSGYHPLKVLTQSGDQVVHVPKAFHEESRVKVLHHSVHQSTPERESFGAIKGTGFFLIRKAEAVLVCHAIISIVLDVIFIVLGLVCWRSSKRALLPT